jgi:hypothetical protein
MARSAKSRRGKPVSKELSKLLNQLTGKIPQSRMKEARALLGDPEIANNYAVCTWWQGCYYCIDANGKWRAIECYAVAADA